MKVLLDACVLYPTVMRGMLLGVAARGLYDPQWSPRILEEWARTTARRDPGDGPAVRAAFAGLEARWPHASVAPRAGDLDRLVLPDPDDVHVLAAAVAGSADLLVTLNAKDFPRHTLNAEGLSRQDPDAFLRALWAEDPGAVADAAAEVQAAAESAGLAMPLRALFKKARLPRLARALAAS